MVIGVAEVSEEKWRRLFSPRTRLYFAIVIVPIDYSENKRILVDELAQRLPVTKEA
jgi:hypothetical protein